MHTSSWLGRLHTILDLESRRILKACEIVGLQLQKCLLDLETVASVRMTSKTQKDPARPTVILRHFVIIRRIALHPSVRSP